MFPVTLTIHNADDLMKVLAALQPAAGTPLPPIAPPPEKVTSRAKAAKTEVTADEKAAVLGNAQTGTPGGSDAPAAPAASAPAPSAAPAATTAPAIKYDDLKNAVFKLAGKSRDAAVEVNKQLGVSTMKELPAERWPEALAAVQAKLAELEVA